MRITIKVEDDEEGGNGSWLYVAEAEGLTADMKSDVAVPEFGAYALDAYTPSRKIGSTITLRLDRPRSETITTP